MSYTTGTTNYDLPQYVGTDTPSWTDTNEGFASLDSAVGGAVSTLSTVGDRVTALESTVNGEGGVTATITEIQGDITTLEGTVSGHTTSITNLGTEIDDVRSDCEDMITANEEASATSTTAYSVGDYFRYNDVLYKCTVNIGIGDTIVPNTNCTATNVMTVITSSVVDASDVTYDNTDSGLTATNVQDAIDEVNNNLNGVINPTADITIDHTNKTWAVCLYNLLNQVDFNKVTPKTKLVIGNNTFSLVVKTATRLRFTQLDFDSNGDIRVLRANIEDNSNIYSINDNGTYTDASSESADNDLYLYY